MNNLLDAKVINERRGTVVNQVKHYERKKTKTKC